MRILADIQQLRPQVGPRTELVDPHPVDNVTKHMLAGRPGTVPLGAVRLPIKRPTRGEVGGDGIVDVEMGRMTLGTGHEEVNVAGGW